MPEDSAAARLAALTGVDGGCSMTRTGVAFGGGGAGAGRSDADGDLLAEDDMQHLYGDRLQNTSALELLSDPATGLDYDEDVIKQLYERLEREAAAAHGGRGNGVADHENADDDGGDDDSDEAARGGKRARYGPGVGGGSVSDVKSEPRALTDSELVSELTSEVDGPVEYMSTQGLPTDGLNTKTLQRIAAFVQPRVVPPQVFVKSLESPPTRRSGGVNADVVERRRRELEDRRRARGHRDAAAGPALGHDHRGQPRR